jgi:hypothetical protein
MGSKTKTDCTGEDQQQFTQMTAHNFLFDFTQKVSLYAKYEFNKRAESYLCTSCDMYVGGSYVKNMLTCYVC